MTRLALDQFVSVLSPKASAWRSAPVLGRRNSRLSRRAEKLRGSLPFVRSCARGQTHSAEYFERSGKPVPRLLCAAAATAGAATTETAPDTTQDTEEKVKEAFEKQWKVIVWNDPVNLMSYVVFVFMKVLAFPKQKATQHMLQVHHQGKSCVATETRERAELYHQQLQGYGLTVTLERD
jgi:ATP-dependent Clp protease adaptor protein ClpS